MAIATRSEIKTLLQISGTAKDDLIDALIPIIQDDICIIQEITFILQLTFQVRLLPLLIAIPIQ